jgi:hypothetical protein
MDQEAFDDLTRSAAGGPGTRWQALRALSGALLSGGFGGVAAWLGLLDETAAKATKRRAKSRRKRGPRAEPKTHEQLHAQGRGKGKGMGKGKKGKGKGQKTPPLPPGCQACNECQMCQDGACVPDSALAGVPCLGSGATCSHCLLGVCTANEQLPCPDGICVRRGQCCSGEKYCSDPESSTGFSCIDPNGCCPGQKTCGSTCVSISACCPGEKRCGGGPCVSDATCCPDERQCRDGVCVAAGTCCLYERRCGDTCIAKSQCCADQRQCGLDCIPAHQCCDFLTPTCGPYAEPVCKQGADAAYWDCKPVPNCPEGWVLCPGEPSIYGGCCDPSAYYVNGDGYDFCLMIGSTPCHP